MSPQVQRLRLAQDGNQEGSPGESFYTVYTELGLKMVPRLGVNRLGRILEANLRSPVELSNAKGFSKDA